MFILISIFVFYAIGIITYELNVFSYYFVVLLVFLIYNTYIKKKIIYNLVILIFVVFSFVNCHYNSIYILKQYNNDNINIIASINKYNKSNSISDYNGYNASIISINEKNLSQKENTIIYIKKDITVKENSTVRLNGRVGNDDFSKNKMLFSYNNYLRAKKIGSVVFVNTRINILNEDYSFLNKVSIDFRDYVEDIFYKSLNHKNASIILSILLGDVDYLDNSVYNNVKLMGLAHIFAVSGTHVALLYKALVFIFKRCLLSRKKSFALAWMLIWTYGFLIGFPLTVMRALVMFTLLFGSEVFYRKYNSMNSLGLAALILTLYNPFWIFDAGFLLSFSAALSLAIYNKYIIKHINSDNIIMKALYLYLFLQFFTLPVLAYYFNYIPLMGIIYNLLLLPIFTFVLIYGFILIILSLIFFNKIIILFKLYNYILFSLRYIIELSDSFAFNGVIVPSFSLFFITTYYIIIIFFIYLLDNKNWYIVKCGFTGLIGICYLSFIIAPISDNSLYFNIADAGQGLFSTVKYKNTNLIFDCGSISNKKFGEYVVLPYVIKRGANNIDGVFISHWDLDHYSGLDSLIKNVKVKRLFASNNNDKLYRGINNIKRLAKGDSIIIDDKFSVYVLWPEENYISNNVNNSSLVILLCYNNHKILLTGDIEKEIEEKLINDLCKIDILLVPHHGSKTSSTIDFVEATCPNVAVFSYGKNNYSIPSKEVLKRYEDKNSQILSTYINGEINFILKEDKMYYNTYTMLKSDNYYELYLIGLIPNLINLFLIALCILYNKGEKHEL